MRHMQASVAGQSTEDSWAGSVRRTAATRAAASQPHAATWPLTGRCFSRSTRAGTSTDPASRGRPLSRPLLAVLAVGATGAEAARAGPGRAAAPAPPRCCCCCCCWGLPAGCCASEAEPSDMVPRERVGEAGRGRSSPLDTADRTVSGVAAPEHEGCDSAASCSAATSVGEEWEASSCALPCGRAAEAGAPLAGLAAAGATVPSSTWGACWAAGHSLRGSGGQQEGVEEGGGV